MALKQCPFWVIASILPKYEGVIPLQQNTLKEALFHQDIPVFNCKGDTCQMWNEETKDCGLKQVSVAPILTEIKSTLEEIFQDVEIIKHNVE